MAPEPQSSSSLCVDSGSALSSELQSPSTKNGDATQKNTMHRAYPDRQSSSSLGVELSSELQSPSTKNGDTTQQNTMHRAYDQTLRQRHQSRTTQIPFEEQVNHLINDTDLVDIVGSNTIEEDFSKTETFIIGRVSHQSPFKRLKAGAGHKSRFLRSQ